MLVTSPIDELRAWTRAQTEAVSKGWWVLLTGWSASSRAPSLSSTGPWTTWRSCRDAADRPRRVHDVQHPDRRLAYWSIALGLVEIFVGIGVRVARPGSARGGVVHRVVAVPGKMAIAISSRQVLLWGPVLVAGILEVVAITRWASPA
jgi:hypothetical protein